jgi:hypothetical protein
MNASVQQKWEAAKDSLLSDVRDTTEVVVRIPGWKPVGIEMALQWMKSSIYQGFYVAHKVERSGTMATVWMKVWEFGKDEPDWSRICAS